MPPRSPELPEGTDHIINGAMETGSGTTASTGSSGGIGGTSGGGGGSSTGSTGSTGTGVGTSGNPGSSTGGTGGGAGGFIAAGGGDGTGGTSKGTGGSTGTGGGSITEKLAGGVRSQVSSLTDQATTRAREYADTGKERATSALDDFAEVINDAARSIDERLGSQYGEYAHRAADSVTSLSESIRGKTIDELIDQGRDTVRKSPGIAIGTAAVLGFAIVRLVKAGLDTGGSNGQTGGTGRNGKTGSASGTGGSTSGRSA